MENRELIPLTELCQVYEIDIVFIDALLEYELIEVTVHEQTRHLPISSLSRLEQIVRINQDLEVNIEGVDVILNLLQKVSALELELDEVKSRLSLYEG